MNWNHQPADISKGKFFTASNDATHVTTGCEGMSDEEVLQKLFSASNAGDNLKLYNGDTSNCTYLILNTLKSIAGKLSL